MTVMLLIGMTRGPIYGPYVRGQLALAGIDLRADLCTWLDAVYAIYASAPFEQLDVLARQLVTKTAQLDPKEARKDWGRRPEHRAMAGGLGRGPGLEAGGHGGAAPSTVEDRKHQVREGIHRLRDRARRT
jgi:hypothetical protein